MLKRKQRHYERTRNSAAASTLCPSRRAHAADNKEQITAAA